MTARRWLAALLLALAPAVAGCGGGEGTDTPGAGGAGAATTRVRVNLGGDPASLSLLGKTDRYSETVAEQITDSLVQYDADLRLQPRLAESWEFSEDHLTLTFRLREGLRWHDGRPVTADDVVFSVGLARDPANENRSYLPMFDALRSIEAPDARTVRAVYETATPDVLDAWRLPILPRHAIEGTDLLTGPFRDRPIGCGPFRFLRYERGQRIELEANDDYWDGRPAIDRLTFRIYPDLRTAQQALLRGDLDIATLTPELWRSTFEEPGAEERFVGEILPRNSVWLVAWNQDGSNPFFTDFRVRRAMVHALDRETFVRTVAEGTATPATTTYSALPAWELAALAPRAHDPQEARRLLREAGWIDRDGDGILDRNGVPFRFRYLYGATQRLADDMTVWQQQSWKELGIDARIEKLEWNAFRERRNAHEFDAAAFSLSFTSPDQRELYHSAFHEDGFNFAGLADPEVDRLTEAGRRAFDPERRGEIYDRLQRRLHELEPLGVLFRFSSPLVRDGRLEGVSDSPLGYLRTTDGPRTWRWAAAD